MFERFARHTQASPLFARYGRVRGVPLLDHAAALTPHAPPAHSIRRAQDAYVAEFGSTLQDGPAGSSEEE